MMFVYDASEQQRIAEESQQFFAAVFTYLTQHPEGTEHDRLHGIYTHVYCKQDEMRQRHEKRVAMAYAAFVDTNGRPEAYFNLAPIYFLYSGICTTAPYQEHRIFYSPECQQKLAHYIAIMNTRP